MILNAEPTFDVSGLTDCIEYKLFPDEAVLTACTPPIYTIATVAGTAINGDTFEIDGHTFTIDDTVPFTGSMVDLLDTPNAAINLAGMLNNNPNFYPFATILAVGADVTITYTDCRDDVVFDFGVVDQLSVTPDPGNAFIDLANKFCVATHLFDDDTGLPICPIETVPALFLAGSLRESCRDFTHLFCDLLAETTKFPSDITSPTVAFTNNEMIRNFFLRYGSKTVADDGCTVLWSTFVDSNVKQVVNIKADEDATFGIRKFIFNGANLPCFLTNSPTVKRVCGSQDEWLWYYGNYIDVVGGAHNYGIELLFYDENGAVLISAPYPDTFPDDGMMVWPVGPNNLPVAIPTGTVYYTVQVLMDDVTPASEIRTYSLTGNCCTELSKQLNFLNHYGGYDTIMMDREVRREVLTTGVEVDLSVDCDNTTAHKLGRGHKHVNWEAKEVIRLTYETACNEENLRWLRMFGLSQYHFIKEEGKIRRFFINPGKTRIFEQDGKTRISTEGYFDLNVPC